MRRCRSLPLSSTAIAGIWLCWLISIRAETTGLFHPDAQHISNRLYRELHVRKEPNGKEHGFDALDPLLWSRTSYLLDGKSWAQALGLADEFLRTHAERQISDRTKRAMLQRDVWAIFDWTDQSDLPHQTERRELMARLAPIVRRLALSPEELAQLPDTYVRARCRTMNSPQHTTQPTPIRLSFRLTCSTREGRGFASARLTTIWRRRCTTCLSLHVPYSWSSPVSPEDAPQR